MANLERLQTLRGVAADVLERRNGDFGFNSWECGTYACLLGHYARETNQYLWHGVMDSTFNGPVFANAALHFGITERQARRLFRGTVINLKAGHPSPSAYAELERRLRYLDKIIKHHTIIESPAKPSKELVACPPKLSLIQVA